MQMILISIRKISLLFNPTSTLLEFGNTDSSNSRLWDTALKFFFPVLQITSPDHLVIMVAKWNHDMIGLEKWYNYFGNIGSHGIHFYF